MPSILPNGLPVMTVADPNAYVVEGHVASPDRLGVGGLRVQIVDRNIGPSGQDVVLGEATTDAQGAYRVQIASAKIQQLKKAKPDLQTRVFAGTTSLASSAVQYNAGTSTQLDVLLPPNASALPSEYETLKGVLAQQYSGNLRDLKETADQPDITFLANKSGWDARAVAFAARADDLSANAKTADGKTLDPALYYALFRAGIPSNDESAFQASAETVTAIWKQAIAQGVVPAALESTLPQAAATFQALAATHLLSTNVPPVPGTSTFGQLLDITLKGDGKKQEQFADVYTKNRNDSTKLWSAVESAFGTGTKQKLQLDGQLAYLTLNNAPLIDKLYTAEAKQPPKSPLELVKLGYYDESKWKPLIVSGGVPIPTAITDSKTADGKPVTKEDRYAQLLAAQLRLSYPTAAIAERVNSQSLPLNVPKGVDINKVRSGVYDFLTKYEDQSKYQVQFEIGMHPIDQFLLTLDQNKLPRPDPDVVTQLKRLQRAYQISPNDTAMKGLLDNNIHSAYQVVQYQEDEFVTLFQNALGGEPIARLTYAKAQQVSATVLNIVAGYMTARQLPAFFGKGDEPWLQAGATTDPKQQQADSPNATAAYATLESLFGSTDYCACDECRSVLSPAAYLVDLLKFIDPPGDPTLSADKRPPTPLDILLRRRPDLQYLPLTCENTNTPLPYIDVVNETLEWFVAKGSLTGKSDNDTYKGYDTGDDVTGEELLASPQNVNDAAYKVLQTEFFPPPLPFHRWLELLRRLFAAFPFPLHEAMEALRKDELVDSTDIKDPALSKLLTNTDYFWHDILMERLKLSRPEYQTLTDSSTSLQQLGSFPNWTSVQAFARRLGVSYDDVVALLRTEFVNPGSTLLPRFERLYLTFSDLQDFFAGKISDTNLNAKLPSGLDLTEYDGNVANWLRTTERDQSILQLITIANPKNSDDFCAIDDLQFRYASANTLRPVDFVRMLRFIQLWRKLGLTIDQTDQVISALYSSREMHGSKDDNYLRALDTGFVTLLPRIGIVFQVIERLNLQPDADLPSLLACWSPIGTYGPDSLYQQMFLSPSILQADNTFADDGYGNFLSQASTLLKDHVAALRAAFALTDAEYAQITTTALHYDETTTLTLDTISDIYRRAWLARTLNLSVQEFLLLTKTPYLNPKDPKNILYYDKTTGLDPFADPDPPNPPIVRLLQLLEALKAVSMTPAQALYLIWNQDVSGKSAPDNDQITALARTLRTSFAAVESDYAVVADPTGAITRARMALVYGSDAADFFFGLLYDQLVQSVQCDGPVPDLSQTGLPDAAKHLSYDNFRKTLAYSGVLGDDDRQKLQAITGASDAFKQAMGKLYTEQQQVINNKLDQYPDFKAAYQNYVKTDPTKPITTRRQTLLDTILQDLKEARKNQQALTTVAAAANLDAALVQTILTDAAVLQAVGDTKPAQAAIANLKAIEPLALPAQFYPGPKAEGPATPKTDQEGTVNYGDTGGRDLPYQNPTAGGPISAIWRFYLEAPQSGLYNLEVETDPGATITLSLENDSGKPVSLALLSGIWSNGDAIPLTGGKLYMLTFKAENVTKALKLRWITSGRGREIIPGQYIYPTVAVDQLRSTYIRLLKAASLATALKTTANEFAFLARSSDYAINGVPWLNAVPAAGDADAAAAPVLYNVLLGLLDFAQLKAALSPNDERLLTILQYPTAPLPDGVSAPSGENSLLASVTGWDDDSVKALLKRFTGRTVDPKNPPPALAPTDLRHLSLFRRFYDAFKVVKASGVAAATLLDTVTNDPGASTVATFQAALRARYRDTDWLAMIKPINDEMRGLQRDALVAYTLQLLSKDKNLSQYDTPDRLFEYFLMDVQVESCRETSRIRHALSSVQLFIERCIMNMEPDVVPSVIDASQWEWRKRYRVWEANREVFLWPENWLEPELRDDQSPIFKETMSELLQSDITDDAAATALLNYISKLEEVAKLEPCGMWYEEPDEGTDNAVSHVVARTAGAHRKYFYRKFDGSTWSPWEQIPLDIEDNPVIPVVWNNRLLLFWLRILKDTATTSPSIPKPSKPSGSSDPPKLTDLTMSDISDSASPASSVTVKAVLCWSEYYNGKWQSPKSSDVNNAVTFDPPSSSLKLDRSLWSLGAYVDPTGPLQISITPIAQNWFYYRGPGFALYNTHSVPLLIDAASAPVTDLNNSVRWVWLATHDKLVISYNTGDVSLEVPLGKSKSSISHNTVAPLQQLRSAWSAPFLFEDTRNVFYVVTDVQPTTVPKHDGYGAGTHVSTFQSSNIPPATPLPILLQGPWTASLPFTAINRLLFQGTAIGIALGTNTVVPFGGIKPVLLGPSGALLGNMKLLGQQ